MKCYKVQQIKESYESQGIGAEETISKTKQKQEVGNEK